MATWYHKIDFVAKAEVLHNKGELSLIAMARYIYKEFVNQRWVWSEDPEAGFTNYSVKENLTETAHDELSEIVDSLHTIAYADEIFEESEPKPTVADYDAWKSMLYDWADRWRVWITPTTTMIEEEGREER